MECRARFRKVAGIAPLVASRPSIRSIDYRFGLCRKTVGEGFANFIATIFFLTFWSRRFFYIEKTSDLGNRHRTLPSSEGSEIHIAGESATSTAKKLLRGRRKSSSTAPGYGGSLPCVSRNFFHLESRA